MAEVIRLAKVRRERSVLPKIRGVAREVVTDATRSVGEPCTVVVVALGAGGDYAVRHISDGRLKDIDGYGRAIAVLQHQQGRLVEDG